MRIFVYDVISDRVIWTEIEFATVLHVTDKKK
jgi:hypothetical protein